MRAPACTLAARWSCWACNAPFPFTPSSPAPQPARQARSRPWGRPPGTPGPARCSPLLTVALSFLSSVRAVPPGTGEPGHLWADVCQRWALRPRILLGEFPQGLGLLPGMLPSFPASRDPALFSPTVLCQWPFRMEMPSGGNFWLPHWRHPAHNPGGKPEGEDLNGMGSLVPAEARTQQTSLVCQAALRPARRSGAGRGAPEPTANRGCSALSSTALSVARGELPSAARRQAASAASICPAPRTGNASRSTLGGTGRGCQQQPSCRPSLLLQGGTRSDTFQPPARSGARAWRSFLVPCPPHSTSHHAHPFCPPVQVLLLGASPSAGSGGSSIAEHHLRHLPGARGGRHVLPDHGVPGVQTGLVPPGLHQGRSPPLAPWAWPVLSSSQPRSRSCSCLCFSCRNMPYTQPPCVSSAPSAEERGDSDPKWPRWGSKFQSGWCPSARLCTHSRTAAVPAHELPRQAQSLAILQASVSSSRSSWE